MNTKMIEEKESIKMSEEKEKKFTDTGLEVVRSPKDVERFRVGDTVQMHLVGWGKLVASERNGMQGVVESLSYEDEGYFYHMSVVDFVEELRLVNPDHLIVVRRADGTAPEADRLAQANEQLKRLEDSGESFIKI